MRYASCTLLTLFGHIHFYFSAFVRCHTQNLMSSSSLLPQTRPTRWKMSPQRHIILKYTALFMISLFSPQWIEEVRSICGPTIPVILVGCKADLRPLISHPDTSDNPCPWVTRERGERVAKAIGARAYKECSALKIEGVDDVFETATRASMLMRDGAPNFSQQPLDSGKQHHRRRSSGKGEDGKSWACCVIC